MTSTSTPICFTSDLLHRVLKIRLFSKSAQPFEAGTRLLSEASFVVYDDDGRFITALNFRVKRANAYFWDVIEFSLDGKHSFAEMLDSFTNDPRVMDPLHWDTDGNEHIYFSEQTYEEQLRSRTFGGRTIREDLIVKLLTKRLSLLRLEA